MCAQVIPTSPSTPLDQRSIITATRIPQPYFCGMSLLQLSAMRLFRVSGRHVFTLILLCRPRYNVYNTPIPYKLALPFGVTPGLQYHSRIQILRLEGGKDLKIGAPHVYSTPLSNRSINARSAFLCNNSRLWTSSVPSQVQSTLPARLLAISKPLRMLRRIA
ncbi:hypothetical protein BD779DRAFT_324618 [Infundibulicybe gibba]|nr:hypothetical protein BD779DRAFT_324618 [Infundibulicybe gibba]